jgi:DNA-binding NtrC family response regulator
MRMPSGQVRRRRVLLIDPDPVYRAGLEELLGTLFWTAMTCDNVASTLEHFAAGGFDAVWIEWDLRDPAASVEDLLIRARRLAPTAALMVVTATRNVDQAKLAAIRVGAHVFAKRDTQQAAIKLTELEDARIARLDGIDRLAVPSSRR